MTVTQTSSKRILLSAYACEPDRGSEPGVGWHWALTLAGQGHRVWVLTRRNNQARIQLALAQLDETRASRLSFLYYDLPRWAAWWKKGGRGIRLYYAMWQRGVLRMARAAHRAHRFDIVHHVTFGVWRQPSLLYRLGVPFVYGPVGGGESAPSALRNTLPFRPWVAEWVREWANALSLLNPTLRSCLRRASLVVSKTPETAAWAKHGGARAHAVSLEIGIDSAGLMPRSADRVDGAPLHCFYAGRLVGWKGVHLAIDALAETRRMGGNAVLTIVGEGPMRIWLEQRVIQDALQRYVRFIPWLGQADLFQEYRDYDVLLFPSFHDSSGNVVLEAMAHGLPVVCLKLGGPGVLINDSCGYAIEATGNSAAATVQSLARALQRLETDVPHWRRLREGALLRAASTTWDVSVSTVYRALG